MLPQQRNEAKIERAINYARKVLNAAENSNQGGEDLIVVMASGADLYYALKALTEDVAIIIERKSNCGDWGAECPLQDSHKKDSTEDRLNAALDVLARVEVS